MIDRLTETRRDKSLDQYMEALSGWRAESASADFHVLRQDFSRFAHFLMRWSTSAPRSSSHAVRARQQP